MWENHSFVAQDYNNIVDVLTFYLFGTTQKTNIFLWGQLQTNSHVKTGLQICVCGF